VLYASTQRLATFVECLARFRPDPAVAAGLEEIEGDPEGALQPGQLPRSWVRTRRIGTATLEGDFADVGHSESLQWLRSALAGELVEFGLEDLDAATIRVSAPRRLTQLISRAVYEETEAEVRRFAGIRYLSRLGDDFENWAIFEGGGIDALIPQNLFDTDPDLREALQLLNLSLVEA
jgi:hypothetical protein